MAGQCLGGPLEELAFVLDGAHTLSEVGTGIVAYAHARLPVDAVVLTVGGESAAPRRLAATGPLVSGLDALLGELGHGPPMETLPAGGHLTIDDTRGETAWPAWSAAAGRHGVRWVRLVGLLPLADDWVRLDLFSHTPHALSGDVLERADELANGAGLALRIAHRVVHLEDAMRTRDLIGQAQGVVMERFGLDAEQAMSFLRRRSQESQVKLRDLVHDLVEGAARPAAPTESSGRSQ